MIFFIKGANIIHSHWCLQGLSVLRNTKQGKVVKNKIKFRTIGLSGSAVSYNQTLMNKGKFHYQCKLDTERNFAHY